MRSPRLAPEEIVMEPATLQALRQRLRARALRTGPGRWRVPDDLVDFAFDTTIDGFLRGRYPLERLARTAIVILDHAARSGPDRRDLSARVLSLDSTARDWQTPIPKCSYSPQERATLESLLRSGVTTLTPHEQRAAIATLSATSQRAAAAATGMSLRNFRTRLARAERKLRRLTEREARGKIARLLDSCAGCCAPPPLPNGAPVRVLPQGKYLGPTSTREEARHDEIPSIRRCVGDRDVRLPLRRRNAA